MILSRFPQNENQIITLKINGKNFRYRDFQTKFDNIYLKMSFEATGAESLQENKSLVAKAAEYFTLIKESPIGTLATHAAIFAVGVVAIKSNAAELLVPQL
ncbi:hypothetical protein QEN19_002221 [Hanseniaspora menglaensis]